MRSDIRHAPSGLILDFSMPDFGGPEQAAIIQAWRDGGHTLHGKRGEYICIRHELLGAAEPDLYLADHGNRAGLFAAHFPGSGLAGTHEIRWTGGPSPEHQRMAEYMIRPAVALGWPVEMEHATPRRTVINDFTIQGPAVLMAGEVQRSYLSAPQAKGRTTKARNAGREPLWLLDDASHRLFGEVPSVGLETRSVGWETLPPAGSVAAIGLRNVRAVRCRDRAGIRCPTTKSWQRCNGWHEDLFPLQDVLADEVAERFPAGELVAFSYRTSDGRLLYGVTTAEAKALYEKLTGEAADESARNGSASLPSPAKIECKTDLRIVPSPPPMPPAPQPQRVVVSLPRRPATVRPNRHRGKCWRCPYLATYVVTVPSTSGLQEVLSCSAHYQMLLQAWGD